MDWFALQDPFDQFVPIQITNNWSGGLYFVWQLNSPPAWYGHFSGIPLSGSYGGTVPLAAGSTDTYVVQWNISISGNIDKSGPNTDSLTLGLFAYSSGFFSGSIASGSLAIKNVLFNRYSGVIKVFGDAYSNDQPQPTLTQGGVGTLAAAGTYSYGISYFLSGWESDIGVPSSLATNSGAINLAWTGVAGVTQYVIWRWSGGTDYTLVTLSGTMDLVGLISGTSTTDSGITALQTGMYRHRTWQQDDDGSKAGNTTSPFLSPPQARTINGDDAGSKYGHIYQLSKNLSGVSLLGPVYMIFHHRPSTIGAVSESIYQAGGGIVSGTGVLIAPQSIFNLITKNVWSRYGIYFSGIGQTATHSGQAVLQLGESVNWTDTIDDVYLVAAS
jgi:hypothetical protein